VPEGLIRTENKPLCIGQKQRWFLLELTGPESNVCLDTGSRPEFDMWRWVEHQQPVQEVVAFKRDVYQQALDELLPLLTRRKTG
jgi:putative (di)nucleoside polyphosphate hydrolase